MPSKKQYTVGLSTFPCLARPAALIAGLFLSALLANACSPRSVEPPLHAVDRPQDLAQMEAPVREQFENRWSRLQDPSAGKEDGSAARGTDWGRLGQWFDVYQHEGSARLCYLNASQLAPLEPRWPYYLGRLAEKDGKLADAERYYSTARTLAPEMVAPRVRLGDLALQQQDAEKAEDLYRAILADHPSDPGALFGLAMISLLKDMPADAVPLLETLVKMQPEATPPRYSLAQAYRKLGRHALAAELLAGLPEDSIMQFALSLDDPWDLELRRLERGSRIFTRRGVRAARRGEKDKAALLFAEALRGNPQAADLHLNYAQALSKLGRSQLAAEQLEICIETAGKHTDVGAKARVELAKLLMEQKRYGQAAEYLKAAQKLDDRLVSAYVELGRLHHIQGDLEAALEQYAQSIRLDPRSASLRFWQAALLMLLERDGEALDALDTARREIGEDPQIALLSARLLAGSRRDGIGSPERARRMLDAVSAPHDVLYAETAAMVLAAEGNFDQARRWQQVAVQTLAETKMRTVRHIALRRLALYREGLACRTPWETWERPVTLRIGSPASPAPAARPTGGNP